MHSFSSLRRNRSKSGKLKKLTPSHKHNPREARRDIVLVGRRHDRGTKKQECGWSIFEVHFQTHCHLEEREPEVDPSSIDESSTGFACSITFQPWECSCKPRCSCCWPCRRPALVSFADVWFGWVACSSSGRLQFFCEKNGKGSLWLTMVVDVSLS